MSKCIITGKGERHRLTDTGQRVSVKWGRSYIKRNLWLDEDGGEWVYFCCQFNEVVPTGFGGYVMHSYGEFGHVVD